MRDGRLVCEAGDLECTDKAGEREALCYLATQLTMKTCSPVHPPDISKVAKLIFYLTNTSPHLSPALSDLAIFQTRNSRYPFN